MKKSLFAVAALSAIAGAAQAQSSVTVYGVIDAGYIGANGNAYNTSTKTNIKSTSSQFGQGAESTSRLGFKGTEDLGGGTSAFFTVEAGLTPANASLSGGTAVDAVQKSSTDSGSALNNRQSFVGLKKNGIGQFAFGRQYTPIYEEGAKTDPTAYMNIVGGVVYAGGNTTGSESGQSTNIGFTNRASNALTVASDTFAGFQVKGMYAMNNTNTQVASSSSGGNQNWNGWGLGANYTWQKLYVTANYQSFNTRVTGLDAYTAPSYNISGGQTPLTAQSALAATSGLVGFANIQDKQTYIAGTYDFGILKAYAQWIGRKVTNTSGQNSAGTAQNGSVQANRNAQQIGVRSFVTPAIEAWASVGNGSYRGADDTTTGAAAATVRFTAYQIGSNYYLSKRTNLYAAFGSTTTTSATYGTPGSGTSGNQYAIGARHTF